MDKTKQKIIHGTALEIFGYGVVIIGNSGSGKSELSLKLIDRQHKFIADDNVLIKQEQDNSLWLHQQRTPGFMHLGGIGFVDLAAIYGKHNIVNNPIKCNLFIELENSELNHTNRITELSTHIDILDQKIPLVKLFIAQNRPLELLVEVLVKKQQQLDGGYDANQVFVKNLAQNET